jgi:hypothetical protein
VFPADRPAPQLQVQDSVMGRRPIAGIAYIQTGAASSLLLSSSHFHNLARSCADSDWRSSANQGRGSLSRHTGCTALDTWPRSTTRGFCSSQLAGPEQDHQQLRGANFFERKCHCIEMSFASASASVPCAMPMHTKKRRGAARISCFKTSQYLRFFACRIAQLVRVPGNTEHTYALCTSGSGSGHWPLATGFPATQKICPCLVWVWLWLWSLGKQALLVSRSVCFCPLERVCVPRSAPPPITITYVTFCVLRFGFGPASSSLQSVSGPGS